MNLKKVLYCSITMLLPFVVQADSLDHGAAPMFAGSKNESVAHQVEVIPSEWKLKIENKFKTKYENLGQPKIAIFWNREFSDQLSQWYSDKRVVKTGEQANNSTDKYEPASGNSKDGYSRSQTGGSRIVEAQYFAECKEAVKTSAQTERSHGVDGSYSKDAISAEATPSSELCYQVLNTPKKSGDEMNSKSMEFEFSSGFTGSFINIKTNIVDRASIMRIMQRDTAAKAGAELIADSQKIESDALLGYADYLAEVVYQHSSNTELGFEFLVTVKEISNGRIVAKFKSEARPKGLKETESWKATSKGYKKVKNVEHASPSQVGEQLAYETMEALNRTW